MTPGSSRLTIQKSPPRPSSGRPTGSGRRSSGAGLLEVVRSFEAVRRSPRARPAGRRFRTELRQELLLLGADAHLDELLEGLAPLWLALEEGVVLEGVLRALHVHVLEGVGRELVVHDVLGRDAEEARARDAQELVHVC